MAGRIWRVCKYLAFLTFAVSAVLVLAEGGLRLFFGLPTGRFHFTPLRNESLYRPNATMQVLLGPIPYTVETNSLGFRGPEIAVEKGEGVFRIAAIGDSVTDGFYVDNPETYPRQLEVFLRGQGKQAEVLNAARGGASIPREYEILRRFVSPLKPDLALLGFVMNDLDELAVQGLTRAQMVDMDYYDEDIEYASEVFFLARTALGEWVLDTALRLARPGYRAHTRAMTAEELAGRYEIPGAKEIAGNVERYRIWIKDYVGRLGSGKDEEGVQQVLSDYVYVLEHMTRFCAERNTALAVVYFPDYMQIHAPGKAFFGARTRLEKECARLGLPFVDLFEPMRAARDGKPLFLVPVDYHYSPRGNRVASEAIGRALLERGLLP